MKRILLIFSEVVNGLLCSTPAELSDSKDALSGNLSSQRRGDFFSYL